jgi:hypothetical protein
MPQEPTDISTRVGLIEKGLINIYPFFFASITEAKAFPTTLSYEIGTTYKTATCKCAVTVTVTTSRAYGAGYTDGAGNPCTDVTDTTTTTIHVVCDPKPPCTDPPDKVTTTTTTFTVTGTKPASGQNPEYPQPPIPKPKRHSHTKADGTKIETITYGDGTKVVVTTPADGLSTTVDVTSADGQTEHFQYP